MKRLAAAGCSAVLMIGLAAVSVPAAGAVSTPTITGPTSAPYYSTATLTGHSPAPGQSVRVYFRGPRDKGFRAERHLMSNAHSEFSTTLHVTGTYSYYVTAGGRQSAKHSTRIATATCVENRKPAFAHNPIPISYVPAPAPRARFVAFTANRGGLWAGYAFNQYPFEFDAISWRVGQRRPMVLARYTRALGGGYEPDERGNVRIAGITASGAVVAEVVTVTKKFRGHIAVAWFQGHTYTLSHRSTWTYFAPIGVSDTGLIVGLALFGRGKDSREQLITWSGLTAHYRVLLTSKGGGSAGVDSAGDILYSANGPYYRLRTSTGRSEPLLNADGSLASIGDPFVAAGSRFFAQDGDGIGVWNASRPGPLTADPTLSGFESRQNAFTHELTAASRGGSLITRGRRDLDYLITANHELGLLSALSDGAVHAGEAFAADGTIAITSPKDGLVHFVRCD